MKIYSTLLKYDNSQLRSNTSVNAAVGRDNAAVSFDVFSLFLVVLSEEPNKFLVFCISNIIHT